MKRWPPGRACDRTLLAASKSSLCTRVSALSLEMRVCGEHVELPTAEEVSISFSRLIRMISCAFSVSTVSRKFPSERRSGQADDKTGETLIAPSVQFTSDESEEESHTTSTLLLPNQWKKAVHIRQKKVIRVFCFRMRAVKNSIHAKIERSSRRAMAAGTRAVAARFCRTAGACRISPGSPHHGVPSCTHGLMNDYSNGLQIQTAKKEAVTNAVMYG